MLAVRLVLVTAVVALTLTVASPPTAAAPPPSRVSYVPPVDAPVVDPFRPPTSRYGPGNRGLDYGTQPGDTVRAAADGVVIFAGEVGGTLHVTIRHADGLRTSYSFLATITVTAKEHV